MTCLRFASLTRCAAFLLLLASTERASRRTGGLGTKITTSDDDEGGGDARGDGLRAASASALAAAAREDRNKKATHAFLEDEREEISFIRTSVTALAFARSPTKAERPKKERTMPKKDFREYQMLLANDPNLASLYH